MKAWRFIFFCTFLLLGSVTQADYPWSSSYWWHTMSQSQRNLSIVNTAYQYVNQWSGQSCKDWVRGVILSTSGNHVNVPPNQSSPYDYLWQSESYGHVVGMSMPISNVVPGYIVQMRLASGWPHTAIVVANNSSTVTFIESNWDSTPGYDGDAYVHVRQVSHSTFYSQLQSSGSYSVYYIQ